MTGVYWDSLINDVETRIKTLGKEFLEKDNNKGMSEICFWMNTDKSVTIDMGQIIGVIKLEKSTVWGNRICEYGVYTSLEKGNIIPITKKEHLSLIEALQETYEYCEMEDEEEKIDNIDNMDTTTPDPFEGKIKW
jgi:hypothetical protein